MKREVLEKMGRNLVLFQRVEHVLKNLVALGQLSFSSKRGASVPASSILRQSLGQVASTFSDRHVNNVEDPERECDEDEALIHLNINYDSDDLTDRLSRMTEDRNRFVHYFVTGFDLGTKEGLIAACTQLDASHQEHSPVLQTLLDFHRKLREDLQLLIEFIDSPEGCDELLLGHIRGSAFIKELISLAPRFSEAEGWATLGMAARKASQNTGIQVSDELERCGKKSLTELLAASRLFELRAESIELGGTRVLYRPVLHETHKHHDCPDASMNKKAATAPEAP